MESALPFEVLCEILSYLDVPQRLVASLVCRRWLQACSTQLEDVCLNLSNFHPFMREDRPLPTLPLTRPFCTVTLENINFDQRCMDIIKYLGPQLLHLKVINSPMECCSLMNCPQLRTLVTDTEDTVMALGLDSLLHLQSLDLSGAKDVSDEMLLGLVDRISPNLREFKMPTSVAFDRRVEKRFYPNLLLLPSPSPLVLTTRAVEMFIAKRAKTLTSVRLPPATPKDAALRIASTPGLALTDVDISDCNGLCGSIEEFFELQPRVVALNLFGVTLQCNELKTVVRLLPGLRKLSVSCGLPSQDLVLVFTLRHLRHLCIRSPPSRSYYYKRFPPEVFSTFASVDLRVLEIDFNLDSQNRQELLKHAPALRELKLTGKIAFFSRDEARTIDIDYKIPLK